MGGLSPGILQIGLGAELSSSFNMHLRWPNDIVDNEYRKCGGVLCKLKRGGSVRIGVGINRYAQHVPQMETTGWNVSLPNMPKSTALLVADAALASALDAHPLIGEPNLENLRISAWRAISKILSRGHCATICGTDMRWWELKKMAKFCSFEPVIPCRGS